MVIEFNEYQIINEPEDFETTELYIKESQRIKNKKSKESKDDEDEVDDTIEEEFLKNQGTSNLDRKHIDKLVKKVQ